MGGALLEKLRAQGIDVVALARPERLAMAVKIRGVEWVFGNLDDAEMLSSMSRQTDATIHVAAQHDDSMQRLDAAAIAGIIDGLRGSGKVFITTSASPVYGDTGVLARDEREPVENPYPTRLFRLEHDRMVVGLAPNSVRGIVIRPPFVYGRAGGLLVTLINHAIDDKVAATIGGGSNVWSTVDVDDLADLYVLALSSPIAHGIYNAGSEEVVSMGEIADAIAKHFGSTIRRANWTAAAMADRLGSLMPMMALEQRISSMRAYTELGWSPKSPSLLTDLVSGSYRRDPLIRYSH